MSSSNKVIISAKVDNLLNNLLNSFAEELQVSKSWIIQQALKQYFERYDEYLADIRIASLSETVSHDEIVKEYDL